MAVNLVIADETLLGGDDSPAVIGATGPFRRRWRADWSSVPSPTSGRGHAAAAVPSSEVRAAGGDGVAVAVLPAGLGRFIGFRDQTCRTPYCDAPIRHRDHARPHHRGGPTSAENGLGECERCNYAKESPGWKVTAGDENGVHTAEFVTPTGQPYRSTAPPTPGPALVEISESKRE